MIYVGNITECKCFCCRKQTITPFTGYKSFHAGHIKSEKNGGPLTVGNLLPICRDCNLSMSSNNWDTFIERKTNFPSRTHGDNIPYKTQDFVKKIQFWWKKQKKEIEKKEIEKKEIEKKEIEKKEIEKKAREKKQKKKKRKKVPRYLLHTLSSKKKITIKNYN